MFAVTYFVFWHKNDGHEHTVDLFVSYPAPTLLRCLQVYPHDLGLALCAAVLGIQCQPRTCIRIHLAHEQTGGQTDSVRKDASSISLEKQLKDAKRLPAHIEADKRSV